MSRARYRIMLSILGVGLTAWMLHDSGFLAVAFFSALVGSLFFAIGYFLDPIAALLKGNALISSSLTRGLSPDKVSLRT